MKITGFESFPLRAPYLPAIQKWRELDMFPTIVRVHTDDGLVGAGGGGHEHDLVPRERLDNDFAQLAGKDPLQLDLRLVPGHFRVALYDLVGKALGVPVSQLLGARVRDTVPVAYYWAPGGGPADAMAAQAAVAVEEGYTTMKWHDYWTEQIGGTPVDTVDLVKAVHGAVGDRLALRIDFPMADSFDEIVRIARALDGYNIECFEDALRFTVKIPWIPEEYRRLKSKTPIPQAWHTGNLELMLEGMRQGAVDYFNCSGTEAAIVAKAGACPVYTQHLCLCSGVHYAFGLHVLSTMENATLPSDSGFILEEDIIREPLPPVIEGWQAVPRGAGLGDWRLGR